MFLAQEVHEHNPSAVLFTVNPDLLYLHPEINSATRGMWIFTSYPLFNANQLWSFPNQTDVRLQFPDSAVEGAYNAVLALLDRPDLLVEYGLPFDDSHCVLGNEIEQGKCNPSWNPLWITVVGRDALWPIAYASIAPQEVWGNGLGLHSITVPQESYRATGKVAGPARLTREWLRGMYRQNAVLAVDLFSATCVLFCLLVTLSRIGRSRRAALTPGECRQDNAWEQANAPRLPNQSSLIKRCLSLSE